MKSTHPDIDRCNQSGLQGSRSCDALVTHKMQAQAGEPVHRFFVGDGVMLD